MTSKCQLAILSRIDLSDEQVGNAETWIDITIIPLFPWNFKP